MALGFMTALITLAVSIKFGMGWGIAAAIVLYVILHS